MTGPAALERGYRRLLAWYPQPFRSEHEEEMLAVLLASARPAQRRPGPAAARDVISSALRMRLRTARSRLRPAQADALAVFSVALHYSCCWRPFSRWRCPTVCRQ